MIFITGKTLTDRPPVRIREAPSTEPVIFITGKLGTIERASEKGPPSTEPVIFITGKGSDTPAEDGQKVPSTEPVIFITGKR